VHYLCRTYVHIFPYFTLLSCSSQYPSVTNRWNRWSIKIDINRWQSISINQLILIIDDQSMKKIFVTLSIGIDRHRLSSIAIDCYPREHLPWKELPIDANRWINCQSMTFLWLSIGHRLADTNRYQLTNFIDWYRFIDCISDHRFHRLVTPGQYTPLIIIVEYLIQTDLKNNLTKLESFRKALSEWLNYQQLFRREACTPPLNSLLQEECRLQSSLTKQGIDLNNLLTRSEI